MAKAVCVMDVGCIKSQWEPAVTPPLMEAEDAHSLCDELVSQGYIAMVVSPAMWWDSLRNQGDK